jgi:hypothetical protein
MEVSREELREIAIQLRRGEWKQGLEKFLKIVDEFQKFCKDNKTQTSKENIVQWALLLEKTQDSIRKRDSVALADIAEYEWSEMVESLIH